MIAFGAILALAAAAQTPAFEAPAPPIERVMVCFLRDATLSDPNNRQRFVPTGPHRLLAFRMPAAGTEPIPGNAVAVHDPTNMLLGRGLDHVMQTEGSFGFMTRGTREDVLSMIVSPPPPGRAGGEAYLMRVRPGQPLGGAQVGICGIVPGDDPNGAFSFFQSQPGTRP